MTRANAHLFLVAGIVALFATQSTDARQPQRTYRTLSEAILAASRAHRSDTGSSSSQVLPTFGQPTYVKASSTDASDHFGTSVAVSGDTAVVGVPNESSDSRTINSDATNNSAQASGAAYVFVRNPTDGSWSQEAYLKASDANPA